MSADQDRPLPPGVRRDLDRAAAGIGRVATTAHPDCVCGKPNGTIDPYWRHEDGTPIVGRYTKADCPQHRPEPK